MTVFGLVLLLVVLVAVAVVWAKVNDPRNGVVGCCGCGKCARTGECVMLHKKTAGTVRKEREPS